MQEFLLIISGITSAAITLIGLDINLSSAGISLKISDQYIRIKLALIIFFEMFLCLTALAYEYINSIY